MVIESNLRFSVSMCVYKNDNPSHFSNALESVINQTLVPDEIVLVVDGPVPETIEKIINIYEYKTWFKVIRLETNVGHGNARRVGLENCSYDLVALMDADDICIPNRFEKQIECFKNYSDLSIVGGNINEFIGSVDNVVAIRQVPKKDNDIKKYLMKRCPFNQMTVMFKRSEVVKAGGYLDWYCNEDYYLWIRMSLSNATFKNIDECLVYVRVGNEMYKRRGGFKYFMSEAKLQLYMFKNNIIGVQTLIYNIIIRFIVQVMMPNSLRGYIFKKFARQSIKLNK
jgi:glycosyltransferase involved in cell wall biosynthesis